MIPVITPVTADTGLLVGRVLEFLISTPQVSSTDPAQEAPHQPPRRRVCPEAFSTA